MKHPALILLCLLSYLPAVAQTPLQAASSQAELRNSCIAASEAGLRARAPNCAVREFGKVAEVDGKETRYALYSNFPEIQEESGGTRSTDFANVLVLFEAATGSDRFTPFRISNSKGSYYNSFNAPQLVSTRFGSILHVVSNGMGDGRGQFDYHEFLLWRDEAWVELNALTWVSQVTALLPSGHQLDGIYADRFDLMNMAYEGPVRRDVDCHNCATGGSVKVALELKGNEFTLKDFNYTPAEVE